MGCYEVPVSTGTGTKYNCTGITYRYEYQQSETFVYTPEYRTRSRSTSKYGSTVPYHSLIPTGTHKTYERKATQTVPVLVCPAGHRGYNLWYQVAGHITSRQPRRPTCRPPTRPCVSDSISMGWPSRCSCFACPTRGLISSRQRAHVCRSPLLPHAPDRQHVSSCRRTELRL